MRSREEIACVPTVYHTAYKQGVLGDENKKTHIDNYPDKRIKSSNENNNMKMLIKKLINRYCERRKLKRT